MLRLVARSSLIRQCAYSTRACLGPRLVYYSQLIAFQISRKILISSRSISTSIYSRASIIPINSVLNILKPAPRGVNRVLQSPFSTLYTTIAPIYQLLSLELSIQRLVPSIDCCKLVAVRKAAFESPTLILSRIGLVLQPNMYLKSPKKLIFIISYRLRARPISRIQDSWQVRIVQARFPSGCSLGYIQMLPFWRLIKSILATRCPRESPRSLIIQQCCLVSSRVLASSKATSRISRPTSVVRSIPITIQAQLLIRFYILLRWFFQLYYQSSALQSTTA